jgi:cell division protein FtsI/penicillin-binding protein 2
MKKTENLPIIDADPALWRSNRGKISRFAVVTMFAVAAASQAHLQVMASHETIARANKMHRFEFTETEVAKRGEILARDGEPLAKDDGRSDLSIDFKRCPNTEPFWLDLSRSTGIPATQLSEFAEEASQSSKLTWERKWPRAVAWSKIGEINTLISKWRADGVGISSGDYRSYPLGEAAFSLVGMVRKNFLKEGDGGQFDRAVAAHRVTQNGTADELSGLELSQDAVLRGTDGKQFGVKDRNGNFLPMRVEVQQQKKDGKDIVLTVDEGLQTFAAAQVKKAVEEAHAESGAVVVEDPKTGDLLAVANYPTYKPYAPDGNYNRLPDKKDFNQAFMSCLEPGSMFKILTLAKALDAGVVHMDDHFYCTGEKEVVPHAKPIKCVPHGGSRAMGDLDPVHAIAKSCNIWAAIWALHIGYDPFKEYLTSLGLLEKPNLGVPGTRAALVDWNDSGKSLQLANMGFGQSINCTPVGLIGAFSTLANDGMRVPPRLIKKIGDKEIPVPRAKRVVSQSACDNVVKGMIAVMEDDHGTGKSLRIPGYCIAGKTGTAQKMGKKDSGYVSNFVGFVPAKNPRAVVLVMINKPAGKKYYGAEIAGPVFHSMAQQIIHKYGLLATERIAPKRARLTVKAAPLDDEDDSDEPIPVPAEHRRPIKSKRIADDA